ncbi:hypothetical protein GQ44DRAFT_618875 [Phaeosphaeriaceae sp. PMI808]|nr:hypothetical protein GQ44DRAFT_618875 [Phaeosphaeriaceae sp. PMI808]
MIPRLLCLLGAYSLLPQLSRASVAPAFTVVAEGYNILAKLPCAECPFVYHDTSGGTAGEWKTRKDENVLLLNISLPYDSAHLSINNAPLLSGSTVLPRIFANQVVADTSVDDVAALVESNELDNTFGASFGLSYSFALRKMKGSSALAFYFDVFEIWSDLTAPTITVPLKEKGQMVLEVVLLPRPLMSPGDVSRAYEIVRAELVEREGVKGSGEMRSMRFHDWDSHGHKGTTSHLVSEVSESFFDYVTSGVWTLVLFIMAIIALFVVVCLFIIFGCGFGGDEYEQAQHGKHRSSNKGSGNWAGLDVEKARGKFLSAEELGLRGGGRLVGVAKSD